MLRGYDTNFVYEQCIQNGLCKDHLKELEVNDEAEGSKLQRKALLFIRLQVLGPLLFNKPFSSDKMRNLFKKCKFFPSKDSPKFEEGIIILDSVVTYTLCYLSSVCCAGVLFESGTSRKVDEPDKTKIVELLTKNALHEDDISYFNPIFKRAFPELDTDLIKVSFVTVLLHVRGFTNTMKLDQALKRIDTDLLNVPRESEKWKIIGNDAYKECRYDEAVNAFTSAINFNPYSVYLLKRRAQAYHRLNEHEKAALDYYVALVIDPMSIKTYAQMCYCLFQGNSFTDCIAVGDFAMDKFEDSKETDPETYLSIKVLKDASEQCLLGNMNRRERATVECDAAASDEEDSSKQDVPDLIEASDSDSEMQDDLEASESAGEQKVRKSPRKLSQGASEQTKPQEPVFKDTKEEKCYKLNLLLKEGSGHLLDGLGRLAIPSFQEALNEIKIYPEVYNYQECDIMSIRYAYGCALSKSKDYDDLLKAISVFKDIIEEHTAFTFPAAYYGMALTYKRLNLYKDALNCLNIIREILSKDKPSTVCNWPGLSICIEETRPTHLKTVTTDLIKECENAPPPDATCRYEKCPLRPAIYYNDLDFKGIYTAKCSEQCFLHYHTQCWKILRATRQYTDKAFLEQRCFTPDCEGVLSNIVSMSRAGEIEKTFATADTKNLPKQKRPKTPKKGEVKEDKKRWRKESSGKSPEDAPGEIVPEVPQREEERTSRSRGTSRERRKSSCSRERKKSSRSRERKKSSRSRERKKSLSSETPDIPLNSSEVKAEPSIENVQDIPPIEQNESSAEINTQLSVMAEPFIMLKKDKFEEDLPVKLPVKSKEHKKVKNTISLDEFLESNQSNYSELANSSALSKSKTSLQNGFRTDYSVPNFSQKFPTEETDDASLYYEQPLEVFIIESMKKLIFESMRNLLQKYGPLHVDDPIITAELSSFPHAANTVIADSGGIGELLKHNLNFAVVGDAYVCVVSDVVAAYEKQSGNPLAKSKPLPRYSSYSTNDEDEPTPPRLNPNAKEYCFSRSTSKRPSIESAHPATPQNQNGSGDGARRKSLVDQSVFNAGEAVPKTFCPQQVSDLLAKLTACLTLYESEELGQFRPFIEESLKPFAIVKIPVKACAVVQTEKLEDQEDAAKNSEDVDKLKRIIEDLTNDNEALEEKIQSIQEECEAAVNSQMECTNEFANYKTKIQNLTKSLTIQRTEFEEDLSALMKERNTLFDKLKISEAKEKGYKCQIEKLGKEVKSLQQQLDEHTKSTSENQNVMLEKDQQIDTLIEKMKTLSKEKDELSGRAIYAEDLLLHVKKAESLKRISSRMAEASMRYRALQDTMKTLALSFKRDIEILANQIGKYLLWLEDLRKKFTAQIDDQINKVRTGTPLASLTPVDLPSLGDIPSMPNGPYQPPMLNAQQGSMLNASAMAPPPMLNPPAVPPPLAMPPPPMRMQPEVFNAAMQNGLSQQALARAPLSANSVLPPTTSDLISRVQNQLAAHPIVKPVPVHPDKIQPLSEEAKPPAAAIADSAPKGASSNESFMNRIMREFPLVGPPKETQNKITQKPSAIKQESATLSQSAISNPRLDEVAKTVQTPVSQKTIPKMEEPAKKIQGAVSQTLPKMEEPAKQIHGAVSHSNTRINEVGKKVVQGAVSQESLRPEPKNSYEKLLHKLRAKFPQFTQPQLVGYVKEFREKRDGKLSGLSMEAIINDVSLLIQSKEAKKAAEILNKQRPKTVSAMLVNRNIVSEAKNKQPPVESSQEKKCPWAGAASSKTWTGESAEEDCSICTEDMSRNSYKMQCGHRFHSECIKAWLAKKSDCPICRVHLLLPEEYPALS